MRALFQTKTKSTKSTESEAYIKASYGDNSSTGTVGDVVTTQLLSEANDFPAI